MKNLEFKVKIFTIVIVMLGSFNMSCDKEDDIWQDIIEQDSLNIEKNREIKKDTIIKEENMKKEEIKKEEQIENYEFFQNIISKNYNLNIAVRYLCIDRINKKETWRNDTIIISENIKLNLNVNEERKVELFYKDDFFDWKFTNIQFTNDSTFSFDIIYGRWNVLGSSKYCIFSNNKFELLISSVIIHPDDASAELYDSYYNFREKLTNSLNFKRGKESIDIDEGSLGRLKLFLEENKNS